eukprot:3470013-Pyramimonas_sp.AAC.1
MGGAGELCERLLYLMGTIIPEAAGQCLDNLSPHPRRSRPSGVPVWMSRRGQQSSAPPRLPTLSYAYRAGAGLLETVAPTGPPWPLR